MGINEKRLMNSDEDMEQFFKELIPHIDAIENLMNMYDCGKRALDIVVWSDGYVKAGIYGMGYEISKSGPGQYKIRKEYPLQDALTEVS